LSVNAFEKLPLAELVPYLSFIVLRCVGDDPVRDFEVLTRFLRRSAVEPGRALGARIRFEVMLTGQDFVDGLDQLSALGFDALYGLTREVQRSPSWANPDFGLVDVTNELAIAMRRNSLVAVCTRVPSDARFRKWINREKAPFRFLPPQVLAGTFRGNGRMVWMRGVHRRRSTKADTQALGGIRVQDVVNPITHNTYALRAATVEVQPEDDLQVLRDLLTASPDRSRISWKRPSYFGMFLAATVEALDMLDKTCVAPDDPAPLIEGLAAHETDLHRVHGAFEVVVTDPDVLRGDPDIDEEEIDRADMLLDVFLDVRGDPVSAAVEVDVGYDGALAGTLVLRPEEGRSGFDMKVGIKGPIYHESVLTQIKDANVDGDVLAVYYESGHVFRDGQIVHQPPTNKPFRNIEFANFVGCCIVREKPRLKPGKSLHDVIADEDDDSLFAWVVKRYSRDWLFCDDGAGEVADFLHLAEDGTLTVVHVKAAGSLEPGRRIAVTRFEQVVSQAEKNSGFLLGNEALADRLSAPRAVTSATWYDGRRVAPADFLEVLRTRKRLDKTYVVIVQPHLLRGVHERARAAIDDGRPTHDSYSLMLLEDLLHSKRQTIDARSDGLTVICSK
jgi:hypothetical protein